MQSRRVRWYADSTLYVRRQSCPDGIVQQRSQVTTRIRTGVREAIDAAVVHVHLARNLVSRKRLLAIALHTSIQSVHRRRVACSVVLGLVVTMQAGWRVLLWERPTTTGMGNIPSAFDVWLCELASTSNGQVPSTLHV